MGSNIQELCNIMQEVHSYIKKESNVMQEVRSSIWEVRSYIKKCAVVFEKYAVLFKACIRYFLSNFYFSPNDSP